MNDFFAVGDCMVGDFFVLELHRVSDAFAARRLDRAPLCEIVLRRHFDVPSVERVEFPGAPLFSLIVDF